MRIPGRAAGLPIFFMCATFAFNSSGAYALETLPSFNVDLSESSISGVSAGGFMAGQFHVAYSDTIKGVGIIAGGPFNCAQGNLSQATTQAGGYGWCMENPQLAPANFVQQLYKDAQTLEAQGAIDDLSNLKDDKVYILHGTLDITVDPAVGAWTKPWYEMAGVPSSNIDYVTYPTGHTYPTDSWGNPCEFDTEPPWVSNCGYDTAGETLEYIYGSLNPKKSFGDLDGRYIEFDQSEFVEPAANSMQPKGVAYVPKSCDEGEECRVHVFFHGCEQIYDSVPADRVGDNSSYDGQGVWGKPYPQVGDTMWTKTGLNEWADTNNFIILYPQVDKAYSPFNPKGCWDWWGYISTAGKYDYATKNGPQMKAVMGMMERLAAGWTGDNGSDNGNSDGSDDNNSDGGSDSSGNSGSDSCPTMTGVVNPDLVDAGLAEKRSIYYYTTGDDVLVWAYRNDEYTVYIGSDGKGYMNDPMNCGSSDGGNDGSDDGSNDGSQDGDDDVVTDVTAPDSVTGLKQTGATETSITLEWDANTAQDLDGYMVYMSVTQEWNWIPLNSWLLKRESYTVVTLNPGQKFYFAVTAVDKSGNESAIKVAKAASTLSESDPEPDEGDDDPQPGNQGDGDSDSGDGDDDNETGSEQDESNTDSDDPELVISTGGGSTGFFLLLALPLLIRFRRK